MRWRLTLAEYDFEVIYRPGRTNIADALSRNPVERVLVVTRSAALAEKLKEQKIENETITELQREEGDYNIVKRGKDHLGIVEKSGT